MLFLLRPAREKIKQTHFHLSTSPSLSPMGTWGAKGTGSTEGERDGGKVRQETGKGETLDGGEGPGLVESGKGCKRGTFHQKGAAFRKVNGFWPSSYFENPQQQVQLEK